MQAHVTDSERRTLNIPEVAAWLGISRAAAYELAKGDRLPVPTIRAGKRLLVSRAALERLTDAPDDAPADLAMDAA